ncbi:MAG: DUF3365 domain-containing protein [Epsilonproteobacteria bacterium]|nr:DUF3365 domain-containing protein [Campylobacterota bacterium]
MTIRESYRVQERFFEENLINKAETIFNLIVDLRHWNAEFEGVYAKSDKLEPNPYLKPSSIKSDKNETLIWINPAFMTRQISDIASQRDGFRLKITSDKLINKHNAPDEEEKKLLIKFLKNPDVPYYWSIHNNTFQFMGALKVEKECMLCHKKQGYKVGDVRGGISVMFDITKEKQQLKAINSDKEQTIVFLIIAAIGLLLTLSIYHHLRRLDEQKIFSLNTSLETKVKELDHFNHTLHNKVKEEVTKQREKENLLIQQSKLATLGEMIGNIAHQWRQPISAVSTIMMNIKWTAIAQGVDKNFLDERMNEANEQLQYMSQTIEDFRSFFKPDKAKTAFDLSAEVYKAYHILQDSLQYSNISLRIHSMDHLIAYGYANEFSQVVLNIISNAKDVLIQRAVENPSIEISLYQDRDFIYCEIKDNGGGVKESCIHKIFEPYFTTKEHQGTGIGLYIAKEIIEKHMQGDLKVKNRDNNAIFTITIPRIPKEKHADTSTNQR